MRMRIRPGISQVRLRGSCSARVPLPGPTAKLPQVYRAKSGGAPPMQGLTLRNCSGPPARRKRHAGRQAVSTLAENGHAPPSCEHLQGLFRPQRHLKGMINRRACMPPPAPGAFAPGVGRGCGRRGRAACMRSALAARRLRLTARVQGLHAQPCRFPGQYERHDRQGGQDRQASHRFVKVNMCGR